MTTGENEAAAEDAAPPAEAAAEGDAPPAEQSEVPAAEGEQAEAGESKPEGCQLQFYIQVFRS